MSENDESELKPLLCGCGGRLRYSHMVNGVEVMSCNKYTVCLTYDQQHELLNKLTTEMLKADATIEKLRELRKVTPEMLNKPFDI